MPCIRWKALSAVLATSLALAVGILPLTSAAQEEVPLSRLSVQELPQIGEPVGFGFGSFWAASGGRLTRIPSEGGASSEIILDTSGGGRCRDIGIGEGAVWVPDCGKGVIFKVDPGSERVVLTLSVEMFTNEGSIGVGEGAVWVMTPERGGKTLTRLNAATGDVEATIALPANGTAVLVYNGAVWVTETAKGQLLRVDPKANRVATSISLGGMPKWITGSGGSIWVYNEGTGAVQRVDAETSTIVATIKLGMPELGGITAGGGSIWVTRASHILSQIDPRSNRLLRVYNAPSGRGHMWSVNYGGGDLWIGGTHPIRVKLPQ